MSQQSAPVTLPGVSQVKARRRILFAGGVLGGGLLMSLAAQVAVPVPGTEVPATLQPFALLLVAFALRPARSAAAMLLYLVCGTIGLPVFAPMSLGVFGPTGGYLLGFVMAAWLVGSLRGGRCASFVRLFAAGAAGMAVLFVLGVGWRTVLFGGNAWLAVTTGLVPFAAKAAIELMLAVVLVLLARRCRRELLVGVLTGR